MPTFTFLCIVPATVSRLKYSDTSHLIEQLIGRDATQAEGEYLLANQQDFIPTEYRYGGRILVLLSWRNSSAEVAYLKYVDSQWKLHWRRLGWGFPSNTLVVRIKE